MPLRPENVTRASRIILPAYVAIFAYLGVAYMFTPSERINQSPNLKFANTHLTLPVWGAMFLAAAILMLVALILHRRNLFLYALALCAICMLIWAGVFAAAALFGGGSPAAPAWPLFVAIACWASHASLTWGENDG